MKFVSLVYKGKSMFCSLVRIYNCRERLYSFVKDTDIAFGKKYLPKGCQLS